MSSSTLTGRIRLASRFSHTIECEASVVLVADDDSVVLTGSDVGALIRLLDGQRSAFEIAEDLLIAHRADLVYDAVRRLDERGLLGDLDEEPLPFHSPGLSDSEGDIASSLRNHWGARQPGGWAAVELADRSGTACRLLLTDDYLRSDVAAEEEGRLRDGRSVLLARIGWESVWLGPYIEPGSACGNCLRERLQLNLPARALLNRIAGEPSHPVRVRTLRQAPHPRALATLAAVLEETRAGEHGLRSLRNTLLVRPLRGGSDERHRVQCLPDCPRCGRAEQTVTGTGFTLRSRLKVSASAGGFRVEDPAITLERHHHLVDRLTGAVRVVERVEGPDRGSVHVFTANHAGSTLSSSHGSVRAYHRDHSGGKGCTELDAQVSALCEALERCSALFRGREPERIASLDEVGDSAIPPRELLHVSAAQYGGRCEWNRLHADTFQWIPETCPSDLPISWTAARSLVTGGLRYVPTASVYLGFRGAGSDHVRGDSNGLASGNCIEEAILQGFLELVERDAVAIWWYNRLPLPGVDLEDWADPFVDSVLGAYERLGRDVWALDLTHDLGIPCFAAVSSRFDNARDIIFGFGAHLDADIALRRAVAEMNQMLPTVLKSPDERARQLLPEFRDAISWWETAHLDEHPHLRPDAQREPRRRSDVAEYRSEDLLADVQHCVSLVRRRGMDLLVCDLTRPDIGLSVARVFVPPLRHFWRRLAPGRLYDVPVAMGLRKRPLAEEEMNPTSLFV